MRELQKKKSIYLYTEKHSKAKASWVCSGGRKINKTHLSPPTKAFTTPDIIFQLTGNYAMLYTPGKLLLGSF